MGEPGTSDGTITNTALGIPTISLEVPGNFVADGDLSEWFSSGIDHFEMGPTMNSFGTPHVIGTVTDVEDLFGTIFLAMDNDYLYVAAEATDDVYEGFTGSGNWWEHDVFELFIMSGEKID